jgi:hypothetical protein
MDSKIIIEDTVRAAQDILWEVLPPGEQRELAIIKLRKVLWLPGVSAALITASNNIVTFALRGSRLALAEPPAWPDKIISALWMILDDPSLNQALGISSKLPHEGAWPTQPSLGLNSRSRKNCARLRQFFSVLVSRNVRGEKTRQRHA